MSVSLVCVCVSVCRTLTADHFSHVVVDQSTDERKVSPLQQPSFGL